eukprot:8521710-Lingulodinium_polyedra.AAC.1
MFRGDRVRAGALRQASAEPGWSCVGAVIKVRARVRARARAEDAGVERHARANDVADAAAKAAL